VRNWRAAVHFARVYREGTPYGADIWMHLRGMSFETRACRALLAFFDEGHPSVAHVRSIRPLVAQTPTLDYERLWKHQSDLMHAGLEEYARSNRLGDGPFTGDVSTDLELLRWNVPCIPGRRRAVAASLDAPLRSIEAQSWNRFDQIRNPPEPDLGLQDPKKARPVEESIYGPPVTFLELFGSLTVGYGSSSVGRCLAGSSCKRRAWIFTRILRMESSMEHVRADLLAALDAWPARRKKGGPR
jgi:hypothetical protein